MKRLAAVLRVVLVSLVMSLTMFACGGGGGSGSGGSNPPPVSAPPNAPVITSAVPGDNSATIGWSAVAEATGYNLYYSNQSPVTKSSLKLTAVVSPYTVRNLTAGPRYYFAVTAYNSVGESNLSNEVSATPLAPIPPKFQFTGSTGSFLPFLIDGNALYVGLTRSGDAYMVKFDKTTGQKIWETSALATTYPDSVTGIEAIGNEVFAFCLEDNYIIPSMGGGKIWFVKLDATSGAKLIEIPEINRGSVVGPAVLNGFLYAYISYDGGSRSIAKIDLNGNMISQVLPFESYMVVRADSTGVYFAGGTSRMAVARYDGDLNRLWYYQHNGGTDPLDADVLGNHALAVLNNSIYIAGWLSMMSGTGHGETVEAGRDSGQLIRANTTPFFYGFLLTVGNRLFGATYLGEMNEIDTSNGNALWSQSLGGSMADWKADSAGLIYITQFGTDRVRIFDPVSRLWLN